MSKRRNRKKKKITIFVLLGLILIAIGAGLFIYITTQNNMVDPYYLACDQPVLTLKDKDGEELNFIRGSEVLIKRKKAVVDDVEYNQLV